MAKRFLSSMMIDTAEVGTVANSKSRLETGARRIHRWPIARERGPGWLDDIATVEGGVVCQGVIQLDRVDRRVLDGVVLRQADGGGDPLPSGDGEGVEKFFHRTHDIDAGRLFAIKALQYERAMKFDGPACCSCLHHVTFTSCAADARTARPD